MKAFLEKKYVDFNQTNCLPSNSFQNKRLMFYYAMLISIVVI